jgi:hypothetical protein
MSFTNILAVLRETLNMLLMQFCLSLEDPFTERILEGVEEGAECWEQGKRTAAVVASATAAVAGMETVGSVALATASATYSPQMPRSSPRGSIPTHLKNQVRGTAEPLPGFLVPEIDSFSLIINPHFRNTVHSSTLFFPCFIRRGRQLANPFPVVILSNISVRYRKKNQKHENCIRKCCTKVVAEDRYLYGTGTFYRYFLLFIFVQKAKPIDSTGTGTVPPDKT